VIRSRGKRLTPITHPTVLGVAAAWVVVNLIVAAAGGFAPLLPEGANVAWEAHLVGYAAGLLLVGPFARLLGRR
jgi:membrane associated rhomboid family serine protease